MEAMFFSWGMGGEGIDWGCPKQASNLQETRFWTANPKPTSSSRDISNGTWASDSRFTEFGVFRFCRVIGPRVWGLLGGWCGGFDKKNRVLEYVILYS